MHKLHCIQALQIGTYIVQSITDANNIVVDRALSGSDADVDFDILADGGMFENFTNAGVTRFRLPAGTNTAPSFSKAYIKSFEDLFFS